MVRKYFTFYIMPAVLPVLIGASIYVLWRPDTIKVFNWLDLLGLSSSVELLRSYTKIIYPHIPEWAVYSLPNGLWAFSYAFTITIIWWGRWSIVSYLWLGSIPALGLGYELLQLMGVIRGVFCWQDSIMCIIGVCGGIISGIMARRK